MDCKKGLMGYKLDLTENMLQLVTTAPMQENLGNRLESWGRKGFAVHRLAIVDKPDFHSLVEHFHTSKATAIPQDS